MEDTDVTDMDVNVLGLILEEVRKVREAQKDQGKEIEQIKERLGAVNTNLEVVRATQAEHGKAVGAIQQTCSERPFKCGARSSDTPPPRAVRSGG